MPKNLGLYNDNLSTPRKKDVDACYGPNNAPPYPVTSVNGQTGDVSVEIPSNLVKYEDLSAVESASTLSTRALSEILTVENNDNYDVAQVRNVIISTSDPSGGGSGDIWIKYTP